MDFFINLTFPNSVNPLCSGFGGVQESTLKNKAKNQVSFCSLRNELEVVTGRNAK